MLCSVHEIFGSSFFHPNGPHNFCVEFTCRRGSFKDKEKEVVELPVDDAYRMAMKSLVRWVERNMDPNKTRVFFTSMSPTHGK